MKETPMSDNTETPEHEFCGILCILREIAKGEPK